MPEGPEVWILAQAINRCFSPDCSTYTSRGKHLRNTETGEDWSFGLSGRVRFNDKTKKLEKIKSGYVTGSIDSVATTEPKLGIDWLFAEPAQLQAKIQSWSKKKKTLAGLMLDQSEICGIGVAWGSEILHVAGLRPDMPAHVQDLSQLSTAMLTTRETIMALYQEFLNSSDDPILFVDLWFENLYEKRNMQVYKKGTKVEVLSRNWWVIS